MRRQAPAIPGYGEANTGQFSSMHIPRAGEASGIPGYTQYGGDPNMRPPRISTTNPPIMLVNQFGTPIRVDWCFGGCSLLNIIKIILAEAFGTIILMFFGCSSIFPFITFGIAIVAATQIFGGISGAHINPVVTLASFIMGHISLVMVPFYILAQCLGAIMGYGLYYVINVDGGIMSEANCVIIPVAPGLPLHDDAEGVAFGREFLMTAIYIMGVCSLWDHAEQNGDDSVAPLKRGLLYSGLVFCALKRLSLNPLRASIPLIWYPDADVSHWIYWVAPILGSVVGACLYRALVALNKKLEQRR